MEPYLGAFLGKAEPEVVAKGLLSFFYKEMQEKTKSTEEFEEGEDLCNCEFSLAYGELPGMWVHLEVPVLPGDSPDWAIKWCAVQCVWQLVST